MREIPQSFPARLIHSRRDTLVRDLFLRDVANSWATRLIHETHASFNTTWLNIISDLKHKVRAHRPSIKGTKLLFIVIKVISIIKDATRSQATWLVRSRHASFIKDMTHPLETCSGAMYAGLPNIVFSLPVSLSFSAAHCRWARNTGIFCISDMSHSFVKRDSFIIDLLGGHVCKAAENSGVLSLTHTLSLSLSLSLLCNAVEPCIQGLIH